MNTLSSYNAKDTRGLHTYSQTPALTVVLVISGSYGKTDLKPIFNLLIFL